MPHAHEGQRIEKRREKGAKAETSKYEKIGTTTLFGNQINSK